MTPPSLLFFKRFCILNVGLLLAILLIETVAKLMVGSSPLPSVLGNPYLLVALTGVCGLAAFLQTRKPGQ